MGVQKLNLLKLSVALLFAGVAVDTARGACPSEVTPNSRMHGFGATTASFTVSANNSCNWTAVPSVPWITIVSGSPDSGNGMVTYAIEGNGNPGSRTGVIRVGGEDFTITQSGVNCTYSISPSGRDKCPNSSTGSVQVATQSPCSWSVINTNDWIIITGGAGGTGSGSVFYTVLSNETSMARSGVVLIAGRLFTINQSGTAAIICAPDKQVECGAAWSFDTPAGGPVQIVSTMTNHLCGGSFIATRTWSAVDSCGSQTQCSQSVAVLDLTPPTVACPPDKAVGCGVPWNFDLPSGSDNCSPPISITVVSTATNVGGGQGLVATRVWRIEDACSNAVTCTQNVTFTNGGFTVACPPDRMVPCTATWNFDVPTVTAACGAAIITVSTTTNTVCTGTFTAQRTWHITDGVTTNICIQTVQSVDQTPPTIICPPDISVLSTNDAPHCAKTLTEFLFGGGQAGDDCGAIRYQCVSSPLIGSPCGGVIQRTHIVYDECGNTNMCIQNIRILGSNTTVSITVTPAAGQTNVCAGGLLTFCAEAFGTGPFTYSWWLDGQEIAGETNSCFTTNFAVVDVGRYAVRVAGMCDTRSETLSLPGCAAPPPLLGQVQFVPAGVHVQFKGLPDRTYLILCSPGLGKPWNVIGSATAGPNGSGEFIDPFGNQDPCRVYKLADTGD